MTLRLAYRIDIQLIHRLFRNPCIVRCVNAGSGVFYGYKNPFLVPAAHSRCFQGVFFGFEASNGLQAHAPRATEVLRS